LRLELNTGGQWPSSSRIGHSWHSVIISLFQLLMSQSVFCLRLGSMMVTLLLILLKQWKRCVFFFMIYVV